MDRWKEKTIGRNMADDLERIKELNRERPEATKESEKILQDVYYQLAKSVSVGKVLQGILLEYMPAEELSKRIKEGIMNIMVEDAAYGEER